MQEGRREMWWLSIMGVLVVLVWIVGGEGVSAAGRVSNLEPERYRVVDLTVGTNAYVDRNYELEGVPAGFAGGVLIRTANDDRRNPPQATPLSWQWLGGFLVGFRLCSYGTPVLYCRYEY
jgi:hypothetical protein